MKVRTDFVSNSSSSSYVLALDFGKFDFGLFVDRVCGNCSSNPFFKKSQACLPKLSDFKVKNEAALKYGLTNMYLAFLGELDLGTVEYVVSPIAMSVEKAPSFDPIKASWFDGSSEEIIMKRDAVKIADGVYTKKSRTLAEEVVVASYQMEYISGPYVPAVKTLERLIQYCIRRTSIRRLPQYRYGSGFDFFSGIYQIDRRAVRNTKILLSRGYDVKLEEWMDLDKLEEVLASGESLFRVMVSYDGGYDNDTVYQEFSGGPYPFDGIPVRLISHY